MADVPAGDTLELVTEQPSVTVCAAAGDRDDQPSDTVLPDELSFYRDYAWTMNPHLSVDEAIARLRGETARLSHVPRGWQTDEVATNIFLLSWREMAGAGRSARGCPTKVASTPRSR